MTRTRTMVKWFDTFVATCAVALACSFGFSSTAYAETESVSWNVTYSAEKQMVSDYNQESVNQALSQLHDEGQSAQLERYEHRLVHDQ